jgi:hypothetical protein
MNEAGNPMPRNTEFPKKLGVFLRYLLAFDLFFLSFLLGGYVHGHGNLNTLVGVLGRVFLVSGMLLGNIAQLSQHGAKLKQFVGLVLLACAFTLIFLRFTIL